MPTVEDYYHMSNAGSMRLQVYLGMLDGKPARLVELVKDGDVTATFREIDVIRAIEFGARNIVKNEYGNLVTI